MLNSSATIGSSEIDRYERDGIVHLRGAFDPRWVAALTAAIDRVIDRAADPQYPRDRDFAPAPQNPLIVAGGRGGVDVGGTMALNVVAHDPVFADWIWNSPAPQIVAKLTRSRRVRFWQDAVFIKSGGAEDGTPWHNDYCTWPFAGEQLPILWIALTDVGADDAPLVTVRGSHLDPHRYYSPMSPPGLAISDEYHAWDELLAKAQSPASIRDVWTVRAGDALLMHSKIIHSSQPRKATVPGRRLAFSTRWLGDDAVWAPDPYTFPIEKLLRDPLMKAGSAPPESLFPVIWSAPAADTDVDTETVATTASGSLRSSVSR